MIARYHFLFFFAAAGLVECANLIPSTCFDSYKDLEKYFGYLYSWGPDHNGGARMVGNSTDHSHISIDTPGTLTLTATPTKDQPVSTFNTHPAIHYLSGTVHSKGDFVVDAAHPGLDVVASMKATTGKGTWPAFWLNGAKSWPPELDLAEWKGSGKVSFNTFNTSQKVMSADVAYPNPDQFHSFKSEIRKINDKDVSVKYYMDDKLTATQYGAGYVGQPLNLIIDLQMEGSSGLPGPTGTTTFQIRNLTVDSITT